MIRQDPRFQILNDDGLDESLREESVEEEDNFNVETEANTGLSRWRSTCRPWNFEVDGGSVR